ncbi:hypothetical protein Tco_0145490 [Tanacetum coccineum]
MSISLRKSSNKIKQEVIEEVQEMLDLFESMEKKVEQQSQKDRKFQHEIDRLLEVSLSREIRDYVLISIEKQKNKMLMLDKEKILSDSNDVQANLLKRIKILEYDFKRSQAQSINFELKLQHQKEKMACDVSWKSMMTKLSNENVLLKTQVESTIQERENIKLEYQNLFNSIKTTRVQNQQEVNELIENFNQKTHAYGDVCAKNQDLLMIISELKVKLKLVEKGKNMNTKFYKSTTLEKLIYVTPLNKNKVINAKIVSKVEVKTDKSKSVTSCSTPKNEQGQKKNANVIARGLYRVTKTDMKTPVAKANMFSCNSTGVASSSSVRRPESKDTNSKKRVLLNTKSKSTSKEDKKSHSSVNFVSNKNDTINSNVSESKANSKKSLIHFPIAVESSKIGASPVVAKSRFSVATPPKATNKVIQIVLWIVDSRCSKNMTGNLKLQRNCVEKFMGTVHFGNDNFAAITRYGDYVQGNLTICHVYYVEGLEHNLFSVEQFCDGGLEVAFRSNTSYVWNLEGVDLLTSSCDSNLFTIFISEMAASSPFCLMSKATSTKSCPMRVEAVNGKRYILIQQNMKVQVLKVWSDNGIEFKNEKLKSYYEKLGIMHKRPLLEPLSRMVLLNAEIEHLSRLQEQCLSFQNYQHSYGPKQFSQLVLLKIALSYIQEYNVTRTPEVSNNSAANTLNNDDTPSSSSIIIEDHESPQLVTSSEEPIKNEPTTSVFDNNFDEQIQEDVAELDGNTFINPFATPEFEEVESSSNYHDPSNMHEFHQQHRFTNIWTKNHPIKQVIGDPSKPVTTRSRLHIDAKMCMYALTVSTTEPTNIKEAMLDHSWIKSMLEELS